MSLSVVSRLPYHFSLKTLKRECRDGLELLTAERQSNEARQEEVSSIAIALKAAGEKQGAEVASVKGELKDTRESYRVQVHCLVYETRRLVCFGADGLGDQNINKEFHSLKRALQFTTVLVSA